MIQTNAIEIELIDISDLGTPALREAAEGLERLARVAGGEVLTHKKPASSNPPEVAARKPAIAR